MFSSFALYDIFQDKKVLRYIPDRVRKEYAGVSLLPSDKAELNPDVLYVCCLSKLNENDLANPDIHFACTNDLAFEEASLICKDRENIFCVENYMDPDDLFFRIQERFILISAWESSLRDAVLSGCDYQKLVDLSEDILRNPIFIQGPDLYLLATSKNYEGSSEIQRTYQKTRYHTAEFIARLKKYDRLNFYKHHTDMLIMTDHKIEPYDVIGRSKTRDGEMCLFAGVSCSVTPRSSYYVDLLSTFIKYIFAVEEREFMRIGSVKKRGSDFIHNLISGEMDNEPAIRDTAASLSIPFSGPFCLYKIMFLDKNNLPAFLEKELSEALPEDHIFTNAGNIIILHKCNDLMEDVTLNDCAKLLEPVLKKHIYKCTVSEPFEDLTQIHIAYGQAMRTEAFVRSTFKDPVTLDLHIMNLERFSDRTIYSYRGFFIRNIFQSYTIYGGQDVDQNVFVRALRILINYDKEHERNLVEILYFYLTNEINATKTAEQIHMSRNNVQYNISRISSLTGLSLEDHHVRFGMLIAYYLLGIYFA